MFRAELAEAMRRVLSAFDADALEHFETSFAGGARIALDHDEFRISHDIDFICSSADRYADLRAAVRDAGYGSIARLDGPLAFPREPRIDAYGIRFPVVLDGRSLRVEIIREARIELGPPTHVSFTSVPCLSLVDCFAEKLLANSDRGGDRDVLSRDLIDLAVLREAHGPVPEAAWRSARAAYKHSVHDDLASAIMRFEADESYRARCFAGLQIDDTARVLRGVRLLAADET